MTHDDVVAFATGTPITPARKNYMAYMIQKCRVLYTESYSGIPYLSRYARMPIYLSGKLYEGILDRIEYLDYDVFTASARTSQWRKIWIVLSTVVRYYVGDSSYK